MKNIKFWLFFPVKIPRYLTICTQKPSQPFFYHYQTLCRQTALFPKVPNSKKRSKKKAKRKKVPNSKKRRKKKKRNQKRKKNTNKPIPTITNQTHLPAHGPKTTHTHTGQKRKDIETKINPNQKAEQIRQLSFKLLIGIPFQNQPFGL